jgi:hypothetical protein
MAARDNSQQPMNRTLRLCSWILAGALALCGNLLGPSPIALWLQLSAAVIFAVGTVRPSALRPIYGALMVAVYPLVWLASCFMKTGDVSQSPSSGSRRSQIANTGA